ncbi:hypothetical protein QQP08_014814 [Theobroma cacao]|nr:hypothetical protein QQP08_014814 [Theobroma cacao]
MSRYSNGKSSSSQEGQKAIVPKPEMLDFDLPEDALYSRHVGDNVASSSGSNVRSFFIGMGFSPSLVEKVIEEKGEDNADLLLETLVEYSEVRKVNTHSSASLHSLFADKDGGSCPESATYIQPKELLYSIDLIAHATSIPPFSCSIKDEKKERGRPQCRDMKDSKNLLEDLRFESVDCNETLKIVISGSGANSNPVKSRLSLV